mgnify:FL=1
MIKTKECKIIYKQCEECGEIKFYKKFERRKGKNGKLYFNKMCNSCKHHKRKMQLTHKEVCDVCKKEYSCNDQEHTLAHHFCSEECKNIYKQKQHEQYYTTTTCSYCNKEYEVLTSTYNQSKEGLHFCSRKCSSNYMKETKSSKETFICENCGKEIIKNSDTYNSEAKHHFCSKECLGEYNTKQNTITLTCSQCRQEFGRPKSAFKEAEHYFCSQKCRSEYIGEHNKKYCSKCGKEMPRNRQKDLCSECLAEERHNEKYIKFNCAYCGKESERLKAHTKGEILFCSQECMGLYRRIDPTKLADISKDPKIVDWSKKVISKFNNTCIKCGKHFDKGLNAHHLNSKDWDKDNMYNIDNGVPLCNECHQDYHMLYGYGNNTEEQFLEWYNEYLDED